MLNTLRNNSKTEKDLLEQLKECPVSEITGIVSISGVTAGRAGGENIWTLNTELDAWRINGSSIKTTPLHIKKKVTDEELKSIQKVIKAETIVRIKARMIEKSLFGRPDALLEGFVEEVSNDKELNEYLKELQKTVTYVDPDFGSLVFDRMVKWYGGNIIWGEDRINLNLLLDDDENIASSLEVAKALWNNQLMWQKRVCDYAVEKLLGLKNESWLEEDEEEITAEEFKKRMKLEAITVRPNGEFEFWHDDGDLFWGHSILISGDLNHGLEDADIPG
ncbi:hypothetical protein NL50_04655 [Clostridium acetobutylicum]|nr:hypothetical protein NL50_04655 [Clostridium acetobutylicum]